MLGANPDGIIHHFLGISIDVPYSILELTYR